MELVAILRVLWDRRIIVALGVLVAVAAGMLGGRVSERRSATAGSGKGSIRMVLDTADSQLVEAAPKEVDTLPRRAALLANALATDVGTAGVARAAGVADEQLAVLGPSATRVPVVETPLVSRVAEAASSPNVPYVVAVSADELTPIITIKAYAPDASQAANLTRAAAAGLRSMLSREDGSGSRGFVLNAVTPLRARQVAGGRSHTALVMLAAALVTFGCWCMGVVVGAGAARRVRPAT